MGVVILIKAGFLDSHPSAVASLIDLVVEHLCGSGSSTLLFYKFCVEKTTGIAQCAKTVWPSPPFWCLGGATPLTFVHGLWRSTSHRNHWRLLLRVGKECSRLPQVVKVHGQVVHEIVFVWIWTLDCWWLVWQGMNRDWLV